MTIADSRSPRAREALSLGWYRAPRWGLTLRKFSSDAREQKNDVFILHHSAFSISPHLLTSLPTLTTLPFEANCTT
jgi:hypothetical protein